MPYATHVHTSIAHYLLTTVREKKPQTFLLAGIDELRALLSRLNLESDDQDALILIHPENDAIALHLRVDNDHIKAFLFDPHARGDAHGLTQQALEIIHFAHQQASIQLSTAPVQNCDDAPLLCLQFLEYCAHALDDWNEAQIISALTQEKQQHITAQLQEMAQLSQVDSEDAVLRMSGSNLPIRHFLMSASVMALVSAHTELGMRVEQELNDIINDATSDIHDVESGYTPGGFTQHQVQLALRATLAAKHKHVFIPGIEMFSGDKARLPYKEIQKQGYKHMAFAWQLTHSHQVAVWVTFNQDACEVQVYDSKPNEGLSEFTQNQFRSLLNLTETDPITLATPFYVLQEDKWSCGAYAYATLSRLAGIQQPTLMENVLDTHIISICLLTACAQEEMHYIREREEKQENWNTLQQLLDAIELYRHQQGHYLPVAASSTSLSESSSPSGLNPDFLGHLANFLQRIVWGNLDRQPSPLDQSNRAMEYLECHFGISPLSLLQQYPDKNDSIAILLLQLAEACSDVSLFPWKSLFELTHRSQEERRTVESKEKPYKMLRETHNQKIAFGYAQMIANEMPRSPEFQWQMIEAILAVSSDKMDEALTHVMRATFEGDADYYIAGMYENGCYALANTVCLELLFLLSAQHGSYVANHQYIEEKRKRSEQIKAQREYQRWCHGSLEVMGIQEEAERLTLMENVTFSPGLRSRITLLPKNRIEMLSEEGRQSLIRFALHAPSIPQQEFEFINQAILTLPLLEPVFYDVFKLWITNLKEQKLINLAELLPRDLIRLFQPHSIPVTLYWELKEPYNRWLTSLPVEIFEKLDMVSREKILSFIKRASRFTRDERYLIESALQRLPLRDSVCVKLLTQWIQNLNKQGLFIKWRLLNREDVIQALRDNELNLNICQSIHLRKQPFDVKFMKLFGELCQRGLLSDEGLNSLDARIQTNLLNEGVLHLLRNEVFSIDDLRVISLDMAIQVTNASGIQALRENIFSIDEVKKLLTRMSPNDAEKFFVPNGINAMCMGYFDLDSILQLPSLLLDILIKHGLDPLFVGAIRLTQLRLYPAHLLHLLLHSTVLQNVRTHKSTFAEIAHAVNDQLIPEKAWHELSEDALCLLLSSNGLEGLREKIFDTEAFKELSVPRLTLLVSRACMHELRQKRITWKDLSRLSDTLIEKLRGTRAIERGALHFHEMINIPEYQLIKILENESILKNLAQGKVTLSDLMNFYRHTDAQELPDALNIRIKEPLYTSQGLQLMQLPGFSPFKFNEMVAKVKRSDVSVVTLIECLLDCSKIEGSSFLQFYEMVPSELTFLYLIFSAFYTHPYRGQIPCYVSPSGIVDGDPSPLVKAMLSRVLQSDELFRRSIKNSYDLIRFAKFLPSHAGELINRVLANDDDFKRIISCDLVLRDIAKEIPAHAAALMDRVLENDDIFKCVIQYGLYLRETITVFPSHAKALMVRVLASDYNFKRLIINDENELRNIIALVPSHAEALIDRVLASDDDFKRLITDWYGLWDIIALVPSRKKALIARVLASDDDFKRFITDRFRFKKIIEVAPRRHAEALIDRVLASDDDFKRLITEGYGLAEIIALVPSRTEALIARVLASDDDFKRLITDWYRFKKIIEVAPKHAEALIGYVVADDELFRRIIRYGFSLIEIAKLAPLHAEAMIVRVLANDDCFQRLTQRRHDLRDIIEVFPSHADKLNQRYAALPKPESKPESNPKSNDNSFSFFRSRSESTSLSPREERSDDCVPCMA